ncbi:MAG: RluA family pseudouridine synthase [Deltaproteobacteria bacterium]|nr:RluA family pseudouridine synthase [Deltaproteobacteria bacterium]
MKLLDAVRKKFKLASTTKARNMIKNGFVQVNGKAVSRPDTEINLKDELTLLDHADRRPKQLPFEVFFEDSSILVTCKPAGISVEEFHKKIRNHVPVVLTHRLDQKVSGVMVFAKSAAAEKKLEASWSKNDKIYVALVEGEPPKPEGKIESYLVENKALKVYSSEQGPGAKLAISHYKVLKRERRNIYRVEVRLQTGRKNQIRVHMSDLGCPIVGDVKYGAATRMQGRIALHACQLGFHHPVSRKWMTFTSKAPF